MFSRIAVVPFALAMLVLAPRWSEAQGAPDKSSDAAKKALALVQQGAATKDMAQAIVLFKKAERLYPRASHNCNIGLAYARLGKWPRSFLYLERCRVRWNKSVDGERPSWIVRRLKEAAGELAAGDYALVAFTVEPNDAVLTVSAFEPDDLIEPGAVWLPFGKHTVTARKGTLPAKTVQVTIDSRARRTVAIELATAAPKPKQDPGPKVSTEPIAAPTPPPTAAEPKKRRRTIPWTITAVGAATLVAGGIAHFVALDKLDIANHTLEPDFPAANRTYRRWRVAAIGLYVAGAVGVGTGLLLLRRARKTERSNQLSVGGFVTGDGAYVSVGWSL
jgi:hypothetical protein